LRQGNKEGAPILIESMKKEASDFRLATYISLLGRCSADLAGTQVIRDALADPSAIVRAAAARTWPAVSGPPLAGTGSALPVDDAVGRLLSLLRDPTRLVRLEACAALAPLSPQTFDKSGQEAFTKVLAEYEEVARENADDPAFLYNLGNVYFDMQRWDEAGKKYRAALNLHPGFAAAWHNLGMTCGRAGQPQEAIAAFQKALAIEPNSSTYYMLGLIYGEGKQWQEAAKALSEALRLDPSNHRVRYNLALVWTQLGQRERALQELKTCLQADPQNPDYLNALRSLSGA
jgi:tetratricopeptide (TPR) repeat protein